MAKEEQYTQVGERRIKLSNLDKILYPDPQISKAEIIQYYLRMAPHLLRNIGGRPLSMIRYPNGVDGKKFYQKDRPEWTPEWIESHKLGESRLIDYISITEDATLAWLANLACLELHIMNVRAPDLHKPDFFVFDLDPPDGMAFLDIVKLAFLLKDFLEDYGYHTLPKTSGSRGVHVITPIHPKWTVDEVFATIKSLAQDFMKEYPSICTLNIKKEARKGKLLLDIYRNHRSQTIIGAYSTRGKTIAPVSMPLTWDRLEETTSPQDYHLRNVPDIVDEFGDAFENLDELAVDLHDHRKSKKATPKKSTKVKSTKAKSDKVKAEKEEPTEDKVEEAKQEAKPKIKKSAKKKNTSKKPNKKPAEKANHKTLDSDKNKSTEDADEKLEAYRSKRNFEKTSEPTGDATEAVGNRFVIHRHRASHLHYDLRLEDGGVLLSWAIPKGMPSNPGIKRLAIETEPHPLKYIDFEGDIPKSEYGGGSMMIFEEGRFEYIKKSKKSIHIKLQGHYLDAEYKLYNTKDKQWIIERKTDVQKDYLNALPKPMLVESRKTIPPGDDWIYENKWDGIRAIIVINDGKIQILSKSQRDLAEQFPELTDYKKELAVQSTILDCEIVCLTDEGHPDFKNIISRMHTRGAAKIDKNRKAKPAYCYVFDCLFLDGIYLYNNPLHRRQEILQDIFKDNHHYRFSDTVDDGQALFDAVTSIGLEGVIAKKKNSKYTFGTRTSNWLKIKVRQTEEVVIVGFTDGKGNRRNSFGALHVATMEDDSLVYRGKVGTGFDAKKMKNILGLLTPLITKKKPIKDKVEEPGKTTWLKPTVFCELQYASLTDSGTFREPVFIRLREDLYDS